MTSKRETTENQTAGPVCETAEDAATDAAIHDRPRGPRGSYIMRNQFGPFCSVCQSALSLEEDDWDECDTCGGEGIADDEEGYDYDEPID